MKSFRDLYGQQWYCAAELPMNADLAPITGYLQQQGVPHRITEEAGQQRLWVTEQALVPQVEEFIEQWRTGEVQIQSTPTRHGSPAAGISGRGVLVALRQVPLTVVLLVGCILGALVVELAPQNEWYRWLTFLDTGLGGYVPQAGFSLPFDEPWRLWTPIFLHFGILHITGNALFLWILGARIERVSGLLPYLGMVLLFAAGSNIGQYLWNHNPNFGGMSGVNYGFVGYILLRQALAPHPLLQVPVGLLVIALVMLVLGAVGAMNIFVDGGIANAAHITGVLLGGTCGLIVGLYKSHTQSIKRE